MLSWFLRARCCLPFQRWKWQRLARLPPTCTKSLRALLRSADDVPGQQTNKLLRSNGSCAHRLAQQLAAQMVIIVRRAAIPTTAADGTSRLAAIPQWVWNKTQCTELASRRAKLAPRHPREAGRLGSVSSERGQFSDLSPHRPVGGATRT